MRFTLDGQHIFLTGSFTQRGNKAALSAALKGAGASITPSITLKTTAMGVGGGHIYRQLESARTRGLTIVSEAQLEEALARGFVELDDAPEPALTTRDAVIGELRPAVATPSSEAWNTVTALMDRCPAEQLGELLAYVAPQLDRWQLAHDARWLPPEQTGGDYHDWRLAQPLGELRGAPLDWLIAMMRGEDSPKYGLVRAISLVGMQPKNADLVTLLQRPSLTALRVLDLGGGAKLSGAVWAALRTGEATRGVEELRVASLSSAHRKYMDGEHHLRALRTLRIGFSHSYVDLDAVAHLLKTSWGEQIETYGVDASMPIEHIAPQLASLARVSCLELEGYNLHSLSRTLSALPPIERLALRFRLYQPIEAELASLSSASLRGVKVLDLRLLRPQGGFSEGGEDEASAAAIARGLLRHPPGVGTSVEQVWLGRWWTQELSDAISARGIEVSR